MSSAVPRADRAATTRPAGRTEEAVATDGPAGRTRVPEGPLRVTLLGFGLIGGSIARALAGTGDATPGTGRAGRAAGISLTAWSPSGSGPREAEAAGLVDAVADNPAGALAGADLVVLAAPPLACVRLLDGLGGPWRGRLGAGATITDVASTKERIVGRATELGLPFVGGHPMAGREASGFGAATERLFEGRPWVVVPAPTAGEADVGRVERLATACGARPVRLTAAEHDAAVAGISHLPLVLAAALVEAVAGRDAAVAPADWPLARELAAGGWQGMTRLARGDPPMGAGILATNAPRVAERLRDLRAILDSWLAVMEGPGGPDADALERRLADARARLGAGDGGEGRPDAP